MTPRIAHAKKLGAELRQRRIELDLTQDEVAKATENSPASISNWELGKALITVYAYATIKDYFDRLIEAREAAEAATAKRIQRSAGVSA
jgi:transcriptional regulator with XRE-family HTH domain